MTATIDYYLAPQSPWAYLGHARLARIARDAGAELRVRPVDFGGQVFPVSGGLPLAQRPVQRQAYRLVELKRFSDWLGLPLNLKPKYFPVSGDAAAKLIIAVDAADGSDAAMALAGRILTACWAEERDIASAATLAELLAEAGLPAARLERVAAGRGRQAVRALHPAGDRRRRVRRAELRRRRRDLLGPGPARLPAAPARAAMKNGAPRAPFS